MVDSGTHALGDRYCLKIFTFLLLLEFGTLMLHIYMVRLALKEKPHILYNRTSLHLLSFLDRNVIFVGQYFKASMKLES